MSAQLTGPLSAAQREQFLRTGAVPIISPATRNELINALTIADLSEFKPVKVA